MGRVPAEIDSDWNEALKIPNCSTEDITTKVNAGLCNQEAKVSHADKIKRALPEREASKVKSYAENRFVLSRVIGRPDLTNHFSLMRTDPVSKKVIDISTTLGGQLEHEFTSKNRTLDEVCWVES